MADIDVVVSGAGVVGLAAAQTFAERGYETLLVDIDQPADAVGSLGVDLRTVALSPVAVAQLHELGCAPDTCPGHIKTMHVWESDGSASITMQASEVGEHCLAEVHENRSLVDALQHQAHPNLTIQFNASITHVDVSSRTLTIDGMGDVRPELLVVAEGTNSTTRQLLGVELRVDDDLAQRAIATIVETEASHEHNAWQVFGPSPLALLPLAQPHLMSLIWSLPNDDVFELAQLSDEAFTQKLNQACEQIAGKIQRIDQRVSFPLRQSLIDDMNPLPWALVVGDAAHTIHPLAGQGVNLGLEDVRAIDHVLKENPSRLNQPNLWRSFNAKRKLRTLGMAQLMSFFSNIYKVQSPYMKLLRNTGVRWLDDNAAIKRQLIREAMGIGPIGSML